MSFDDGGNINSDTMPSPSRLWWIAHVFFWVISGLICYLVWKDRNRDAARKHLIHSLWFPLVVQGLLMVIIMMAIPDLWW